MEFVVGMRLAAPVVDVGCVDVVVAVVVDGFYYTEHGSTVSFDEVGT